MLEPEVTPFTPEAQIQQYRREIDRLSPPTNSREASILEMYQTLLEAVEDALGEDGES